MDDFVISLIETSGSSENKFGSAPSSSAAPAPNKGPSASLSSFFPPRQPFSCMLNRPQSESSLQPQNKSTQSQNQSQNLSADGFLFPDSESFQYASPPRNFPVGMSAPSCSRLRTSTEEGAAAREVNFASSAVSSVLTTDVSPLVAWLNSKEENSNSSIINSSVNSQYVYEDPRIPKQYHELSQSDCATTVAQGIRSILLHSCNDSFRQQCFETLGISSSHEVESDVRKRLSKLLTANSPKENLPEAPAPSYDLITQDGETSSSTITA